MKNWRCFLSAQWAGLFLAFWSQLDLVDIQGADANSSSTIVENVNQRIVATGANAKPPMPTADPGFVSDRAVGKTPWIWGVQADGKILVSTNFLSSISKPLPDLARLHPDGSLDRTFVTELVGPASSVAFQSDGRLLVISSIPGRGTLMRSNRLSRLLANGKLDPSFKSLNFDGGGTQGQMALQQDGRVLVGALGLSQRNLSALALIRLLPDGNPDPSFAVSEFSTFTRTRDFSDIEILPDGRILCAGALMLSGEHNRRNLLRLETDGRRDEEFVPGELSSSGDVQLMNDGSILYGNNSLELLLLHPNGPTMKTLVRGHSARGVSLQADGRILLINGPLDRVNIDGSWDPSFHLTNSVHTFVHNGDGTVLVGGFSSPLGGIQATGLVRLKETGPAFDKLLRQGSNLTWWRGGTCPEISFAEFEMTTDSQTWVPIGTPTRIPGGWRLNSVANRSDVTFRAIGMLPRSKGIVSSVEPIALGLNLDSDLVVAGEDGCLHLRLGTSLRLTRLKFVIEMPPGRFSELRTESVSPDLEMITLTSSIPTGIEVACLAKSGKALPTATDLARLCFRVSVDQPSQFLPISIAEVDGQIEDGTVVRHHRSDPSRIVILNDHPLLEAVIRDGEEPHLLLYAKPGWRYQVRRKATLENDDWQDWVDGLATSQITAISLQPIKQQEYYQLSKPSPLIEGAKGIPYP